MPDNDSVFSGSYQIVTILAQLSQSFWVQLCGSAREEGDIFVYAKSLHNGNELIDVRNRSSGFPFADRSVGYRYTMYFKQYTQIGQTHFICSTEICNFFTDDIIFPFRNSIIAGIEIFEVDNLAGTVSLFHGLFLPLCLCLYYISRKEQCQERIE